MLKRLRRAIKFLSRPWILVAINTFLIATAVITNTRIQAFCYPVPWAIVVLAICFVNTIFYPVTVRFTKLLPVLAFINGVSLCVFAYCIIFVEEFNLLAPGIFFPFLGDIGGFNISLLALNICIPHFFAMQIFARNVWYPELPLVRKYFVSAIVVSVAVTVFAGYQYWQGIKAIKRFKESNYTQLEKTFMTEKILGMHFIYHTCICEYDGWRPPMHEPFLILGRWLNGRVDPMNVDLKTRLALYKKFFPDKPYYFKCGCAKEYEGSYHNDELWKE